MSREQIPGQKREMPRRMSAALQGLPHCAVFPTTFTGTRRADISSERFHWRRAMNRATSGRHRRMRLAIALVGAAVAAAVVLAQAPAVGDHHDRVTELSARQAGAAGPERQQLMQSMMAADQKLSELVVTMNTATGDKKLEAIAAVVTELVAQRKQMQEQMRMQGSMMEQMMSRMAAMHGSGGMMKGAPAPKKDTTETDHDAHHPEK
jgi:hypothetical protein